MALWSDTVYEGIRTGVSQGLFTITAPQHGKDESGATVWWADGRWQTADSIKAMAARKRPAPSTPRGINDDEGPPVLRRAGAEKPKPPEAPPAPTTPQATTPAPASAPAPAPTATPSAAPAGSASSSPATPPPSQESRAPEDKDRPTLKRGQAGATSAEEAQKKVSTSASVTAPAASPISPPTTSASSGTQPANQGQLIPAISDPQPSDSLPYNYKMSPQEEEQFRKKMLAMAADEIRARAAQLAHGSAAAKPVPASSPRSKATAAKPVQPTFEDVQLHVFDLADINEPELVLTAKARMPQSSHGKDSANPGLQYMITLVVRDDVNGELHKSLANVTDTQHLDVIPRLDLIDAVDVDGDGRAELLFHEVSDTGSAFVVYRVIGNQLYPLFQGSLGE